LGGQRGPGSVPVTHWGRSHPPPLWALAPYFQSFKGSEGYGCQMTWAGAGVRPHARSKLGGSDALPLERTRRNRRDRGPRGPRSVPEAFWSIRADWALIFACQALLLLPLEQTALDLSIRGKSSLCVHSPGGEHRLVAAIRVRRARRSDRRPPIGRVPVSLVPQGGPTPGCRRGVRS
jgi:hypothetical protein